MSENLDSMSPLELAEVLKAALTAGETKDIPAMLQLGAYVDEMNRDTLTALMLAARKGDLALISLALDLGADIDRADRNGYTALQQAVNFQQPAAARLLLRRGAAHNIEKLMELLVKNSPAMELAPDFIDRGVDVNAYYSGNTALAYACIKGRTDLAAALLDRGADMEQGNANGWTALMFAAANNNLDTARLLLERGASLDTLNGARQTVADVLENRHEYGEDRQNYGPMKLLLAETSRQRAEALAAARRAAAEADAAKRAARAQGLRDKARKPHFRGPQP